NIRKSKHDNEHFSPCAGVNPKRRCVDTTAPQTRSSQSNRYERSASMLTCGEPPILI
ncbi:MAG: hypothetical protein ACI9A1_000408, partial [Lentimonas sp.]